MRPTVKELADCVPLSLHVWAAALQTKGICLYALRNTFADRSCSSKWPFFSPCRCLVNSGLSRVMADMGCIRNKQIGGGGRGREEGDGDTAPIILMCDECYL